MSNSQNCGIAEILEVILILQKNASCPSGTLDSCDRPILGSCSSCCVCNTRPVMLYMCGDPSNPLSMPTTKESGMSGELTYSTVFRVEKVENGSATFRVLALNPDETSLNEYITTNSLFTCNLGCVCSIRCLNDTCIENL